MQVDKASLDALHDSAEVHLQSLEPWVQVCVLLLSENFMHFLHKHWDNQKEKCQKPSMNKSNLLFSLYYC